MESHEDLLSLLAVRLFPELISSTETDFRIPSARLDQWVNELALQVESKMIISFPKSGRVLVSMSTKRTENGVFVSVGIVSRECVSVISDEYPGVLVGPESVFSVCFTPGDSTVRVLHQEEKRPTELTLFIDPGSASSKDIEELFVALSCFHRSFGGSGLKIKTLNVESLVTETAQ